MKQKESNSNIKQPEWLALYVSYLLMFIGSDFIITKYANWSVSLIFKGDYFNVSGEKAVIYGICFSTLSIFMFVMFVYSFLKNIKNQKIITIKNKKTYVFWIIYFIYIPIFNLFFTIPSKFLRFILIIILLIGVIYIMQISYSIYKNINQENL